MINNQDDWRKKGANLPQIISNKKIHEFIYSPWKEEINGFSNYLEIFKKDS